MARTTSHLRRPPARRRPTRPAQFDWLERRAYRVAIARRVAIAAASVLGVAILVWLLVAAGGGGGSSDGEVQPVERFVALEFPLERTDKGLTVERTWRLRGEGGLLFEGTLVIANPTGDNVEDAYDEVISKELAATSDDVLEVKTDGIGVTTRWVRDDPVLRVSAALAPGERVTVRYEVVTGGGGLDEQRLVDLRTEWRRERSAWDKRPGTTPTTARPTTTTSTTTTTVPATTATTAPPTTAPTTAPPTTAPPPPPPPPPTTAPPQMVTVPNVFGLTENAARASLSAEGLGVATRYECAPVAPGLVTSQSPSAGSSVPLFTAVTITISQAC